MGRKTEKNYIKRYFLRLFLLVSVLVSVMGIALMQFSKRVVGDEIIKLHQTILRSTAGEVSAPGRSAGESSGDRRKCPGDGVAGERRREK